MRPTSILITMIVVSGVLALAGIVAKILRPDFDAAAVYALAGAFFPTGVLGMIAEHTQRRTAQEAGGLNFSEGASTPSSEALRRQREARRASLEQQRAAAQKQLEQLEEEGA